MAADEPLSALASGSNFWLPLLLTLTLVVQSGTAIQCWECNSRYDRNCDDPFRNATFALKECNMESLDHFPGQKASVCRKIIQKVRDDNRVVRGCGWLSSERENSDCFKRAGTFNVLVQYCSCDSDGCNAATPTSGGASLWALVAALLLSAMAVK